MTTMLVVEAPVGSEPHIEMDAIVAFYQQGFLAQIQLKLSVPVRCANNSAAFPFVATADFRGKKTRMDIIDVFEFSDAGFDATHVTLCAAVVPEQATSPAF